MSVAGSVKFNSALFHIWLALIVGLSLALVVLAAIGARTTQDHQEAQDPPALQPPNSIEQKMSRVDLHPYVEEYWPMLFEKYGADYIRTRIEPLRLRAAREAARNDACDLVELAELSERESRPDKPVAYAHCRSGFRVYVNDDGVIRTQQFSGR